MRTVFPGHMASHRAIACSMSSRPAPVPRPTLGVTPAQQVPARRIEAVHVLERARLLYDKDAHARLEEVVDLTRAELVERGEAPVDHRRVSIPKFGYLASATAAAFARCSHVSTTVSGLSDIDSMPSDISHSARSG